MINAVVGVEYQIVSHLAYTGEVTSASITLRLRQGNRCSKYVFVILSMWRYARYNMLKF